MCPNMSETEYIFMDIVKTATTVSTKLISEGAEVTKLSAYFISVDIYSHMISCGISL